MFKRKLHVRTQVTMFSPWVMLAGPNQGLVHMGSQVLSHTHANMFQHGDGVPTFEPREPVRIWVDYLMQKIMVLRVGFGFLCGVVSPNYHALNAQDCTDGLELKRGLGTRDPCVKW